MEQSWKKHWFTGIIFVSLLFGAISLSTARYEIKPARAAATPKRLALARKQAPVRIGEIDWTGYEALKPVSACESTGSRSGKPRQFNDDGSILWGNNPKKRGATTTDVGMFQISLTWHRAETEKLHLDVVHSAQDNFTYAKLLYDREGLKPWTPSRPCWSNDLHKELSVVL